MKKAIILTNSNPLKYWLVTQRFDGWEFIVSSPPSGEDLHLEGKVSFIANLCWDQPLNLEDSDIPTFQNSPILSKLAGSAILKRNLDVMGRNVTTLSAKDCNLFYYMLPNPAFCKFGKFTMPQENLVAVLEKSYIGYRVWPLDLSLSNSNHRPVLHSEESSDSLHTILGVFSGGDPVMLSKWVFSLDSRGNSINLPILEDKIDQKESGLSKILDFLKSMGFSGVLEFYCGDGQVLDVTPLTFDSQWSVFFSLFDNPLDMMYSCSKGVGFTPTLRKWEGRTMWDFCSSLLVSSTKTKSLNDFNQFEDIYLPKII